ncbi:MAG: hypothetical protein M1380_11750 [Chloroflexi bacterium]|nr:hypothetical protein [Chloroflexota bacterium]
MPSLIEVVRSGSNEEIQDRIALEIDGLIRASAPSIAEYGMLALFDPVQSISRWHADRILSALSRLNPAREHDVLLLISSLGGGVEPAYQIAKLCRSFAKERFIVAVPRQAKSAATLIVLGADQVHMGPLGELGPIDPQLGGLPALGVVEALKRIASLLAEEYPGSANMLAAYLQRAVTVEQIGYCERIGESAVQYAERLLLSKLPSPGKAKYVANKLVYEYKDHSFVIDLDEARQLLGNERVIDNSAELDFAESVYEKLDLVSTILNFFRSKSLQIVGALDDAWVFDQRKE